MKKSMLKKKLIFTFIASLFAMATSGCSPSFVNNNVPTTTPILSETSAPEDTMDNASSLVTELYVQFGDDGEPFTMHLYDNETAAAIANHVGSADWRIPLYNYEGYDQWEVMQYYDIPSRYEIPSNPETVTSETIGTVYYSDPNRIVLFYGNAEVTGEYTPVGYFEPTEEFITAVSTNPVLEGWSNKIIRISMNK